MKKVISMVMGLAATVALAIPVPRTQVLTFTIPGTERYADGSLVADGECFALVWSKDGNFEGVKPDGTAQGEGDEVVYIGEIAKGSEVIFQIEEGFKSGGYFDVWILDTRVFVNGEVTSVGQRNSITHAGKATAVRLANSSSGVSAPTTMTLDGGAVVSGPTIDPAQIPPMMFTSIKVEGDWVRMEAENTIPGVNYTTVADDGSEGAITTGTQSGKITLIRRKTADSAIIRGMVK